MFVDIIRGSALQGAADFILELGSDPEILFNRAGVDLRFMSSVDGYLPFTTLARFVGECALELDTPDFGLRLAARQTIDILGPLGIAVRHASTIGSALKNNTTYMGDYSPSLNSALVVEGKEASYEVTMLLPDIPYHDHIVELALGVVFMKFRALVGKGFRPRRVEFQHSQMSPSAVYRQYFGAPVKFNSDRNTMVLDSSLLSRRLHTSDAAVETLALNHMRSRTQLESVVLSVYTLVSRHLSSGQTDLASIASMMYMHPRTLQRRLAKFDVIFDQVVERVRRETALSLLADESMPLSEVGFNLGYSTQSTLTRSCRRWFGMTPFAKRQQLLSAQTFPFV